MIRSLIATLGAVAVTAAGVTSAPAVAPADAPDGGWHSVDEPWQPYVDHELVLPAERYCGDFDLRMAPVHQDISSRVLSRWDSGGARETVYSGPLISEATNMETGTSVEVDLSGYARTMQRESGSLAVYEALGPVGMGFPKGSIGLPQGHYRLDGRHVVVFPENGPRRMVVDQGTEQNICEMV